jgi:hypothetical protein
MGGVWLEYDWLWLCYVWVCVVVGALHVRDMCVTQHMLV